MKKIKTFLFFILLLAATNCFAEISGPLQYREQDFDVISYDANIYFNDIPKKGIIANNTIKIYWRNIKDSSKFYFHLRDLIIDSVSYNNKLTTAIAIGTPSDSLYHFEITPIGNNSGDTALVSIYYHGNMTFENNSFQWGGVHYDDNVLYSLGVGFMNNYVSTTQHWLACYDHPSDKAIFHCRYKVPTGYFVASNGEYVIHNLDDGTDIFEYTHNYPIATSLLTFNVGKFIEHKLGDSIVPAYVYAQAKDTSIAWFAFQLVPEMVSYFSEAFGPYPFSRVGYVITDCGSMESQTMINYSRTELYNVFNNKDTANLTAAHELSHQWFGDAVTPWDFRDVWLNESFATYCESLWLRHRYSDVEYFLDLMRKRDYYNKISLKSEGAIPLYNFPRGGKVSNYPQTIYFKGAIILEMLRYEVGMDKFLNFLKNYYESYKYKNISTEGFIEFFNKQMGKDYWWFFNQWVYGIGVPQITINFTYRPPSGDAKYNISHISIAQNNFLTWNVFENVPFAITFIKKGSPVNTKIVRFSGAITEISLYPTIECDSVRFDYPDGVVSLVNIIDVKLSPESDVQENGNLSKFISIKNNILNIDFGQFPKANFKIYDLLGKIVFENDKNNFGMQTYDLSNLSRGFYNLVIFNDNRLLYTKKIIIE
ncbi:MAG: T9SS type A sorting domain-containing protein [Candidatus Kapabacteria bacterium]|nr:T9SS type A sorting domain-containing protein [Candidatus Kapabacteria bacterium]